MICLDKETMKDLWGADIPGNFPILLTVKNPDIVWTEDEKKVYNQDDGSINLISDNVKVKYKRRENVKEGEEEYKTWLPCGFTFNPPAHNSSKVSTASITISAIDVRIKKLLRTIRVKSEIQIVALYSKAQRDDGKFYVRFHELEHFSFLASSVTSNGVTATFNLTPKVNLQSNVPCDTALPNRVPAVNGESK